MAYFSIFPRETKLKQLDELEKLHKNNNNYY